MKDTSAFVNELHEKQRKDLQNKKRQGNKDPDNKLPNKTH